MTRVFIVSGSSLFFQGIETLLRRETGLEIVGREADIDLALERIKASAADVVIVDRSDEAGDPGVTVEHRLGAGLLAQGQNARVVGLSLKENTMCIICSEKRQAQSMADLLAAIEEPWTKMERVELAKEPAREYKKGGLEQDG